jgi:hypothetical protein
MTRVVLNAELRGQLRDLAEPLELCDESGRVLATVMPAFDPSEYEEIEPEISEEELNRRRRDKSVGYTTEEVIAHLERL